MCGAQSKSSALATIKMKTMYMKPVCESQVSLATKQSNTPTCKRIGPFKAPTEECASKSFVEEAAVFGRLVLQMGEGVTFESLTNVRVA